MSIDVTSPDSPGAWIQRLSTELYRPDRVRRLDELDGWYRGEPPMPGVPATARDAVRMFHKHSRSNFCALLCEAVRERLRAEGVQTSSDGDATGDAEAWRVFRRARMALIFGEVHRLMLRFGLAYALVSPVDPLTGVPVVTAEDPRFVVSEQDPMQPWRTIAGLKLFRDPIAGFDFAYLYRPGRLDVARVELKARGRLSGAPGRFNPQSWEWDEDRSQDLPDGLMPLVRFANLDELAEFEPHLDLLGRINYMVLQRMTIATLQAFKQRAVKGVPSKDDAGNVVDYDQIFTADPFSIWILPATAEIWESGTVDLGGILQSVRADIQALAAVSRTPLHMFAPEGENQSAEGAANSKEGLIFKCEDRIDRVSPCWSTVMQASFLWLAAAAKDAAEREAQLKRADLNGIDIMWASPARASLSERMSAMAQAAAAGVPFRTNAIEVGGFRPERVDRMQSERLDDRLFEQLVTNAQVQQKAAPTAAAPTVPFSNAPQRPAPQEPATSGA